MNILLSTLYFVFCPLWRVDLLQSTKNQVQSSTIQTFPGTAHRSQTTAVYHQARTSTRTSDRCRTQKRIPKTPADQHQPHATHSDAPFSNHSPQSNRSFCRCDS